MVSAVTAPHITAFDSSTALLRALARYLHGRDFPALGIPGAIRPLALLLNAMLSPELRKRLYRFGGKIESISPETVRDIRAEAISRWMVRKYPKRRYPAVMIGSSNGAAIHLCAALGITWLPQTFLILVRHHGIHPDDPRAAIESARGPATDLLRANPELQLHHMKDPNQDRLMSQEALYFRVKRRSLGETYKNYIINCLEPNGIIFLSECTLSWPTTLISERHIFQHGGLGALDPSEYIHGSPRVERFLERQGSFTKRWNPPSPDRSRPEAEWGFEPALRHDVERFAENHGYRVRRIVYEHPEDLSPLAADFYKFIYQSEGREYRRLVAECFFLIEPWWIFRTGSIPFWMAFNTIESLKSLKQYVNQAGPFDELHIMLFSNGIDSLGIASIEEWESLLGCARTRGDFLGVDPLRYPNDFETFVRYHTGLKKLAHRLPVPSPLAIRELDEFLGRETSKYRVQWTWA